jgi:CCR4-NOT transcription complex subunit 3
MDAKRTDKKKVPVSTPAKATPAPAKPVVPPITSKASPIVPTAKPAVKTPLAVVTQPALQPANPPPPPIKGYSAVVAAGTPTSAPPVEKVVEKPVEKPASPEVSPVVKPKVLAPTPPAQSRPPSVTAMVPTSPMQKPESEVPVVPQQSGIEQTAFPSSLQELVSSFESAKSRVKGPGVSNIEQGQLLLDASYSYLPDQMDWDRPRHYLPKGAAQQVPSYYPHLPSPIFDDPAIYEKLDIDTLFFIFYYQQSTLAQLYASHALKRQSWRFHKKYLTWFQRHEEPKSITEDWEQGTYVYFDYEGAWCQRKKADFRFEYRFLEDERELS